MAPCSWVFARTPAWHVDAARGPSTPSFDHLVGAGEQRRWYGKAECLGGLQVDHELEFGRDLHRQIRWLGSAQDTVDIGRAAAKDIGHARSIRQQPAVLRRHSDVVDRRHFVAGRLRNDRSAMHRHEPSAVVTKPPPGSPPSSSMIRLMSVSLRTGVLIGSIANTRAAASNEPEKYVPPAGAVSGLNMIAARLRLGAISLSSSSHLPPIELSMLMKPVMLPPGRDRLATKPSPTGSDAAAMTTGIVRVIRCTAAVTGVV